jgi:RimJ/RimL family protein N-acetyltransferase
VIVRGIRALSGPIGLTIMESTRAPGALGSPVVTDPTTDDPRPRHPALRTERLVLRPQTLAAARALLAGEDAGLPLAEGYPHADTADALRMFVEHGAGDEEGGWFVTLGDNGRVIGDCGTLGWVDEAGQVEIGYGLAAPYRGRGYGTEAVRALADWVAAQDGVRVVTADVEVGNEPSRRLLVALGFSLTGESEGHWHLARPS